MKKYLLITTALAWLVGCAKVETPGAEDGLGSVNFQFEVPAMVLPGETRAAGETRDEDVPAIRQLPAAYIPATSAFTLKIEGEPDTPTAGVKYNGAFSAYDYTATLLPAGNYVATVTYGAPAEGEAEAEGVGAHWYKGTQAFTVVARRSSQETITASLANSVVSLSLGEWFGKYYTDAKFTVHTEAGKTFVVNDLENDIFFVKADSKIYLSGTATRTQGNGVTPSGAKVTFPKFEVGTSVTRTWHTIAIELDEIGQGGLTIHWDETPFVELPATDVELNPDEVITTPAED